MGRLPKKFGLTKSSAPPGDQFDCESSVTTCTPQLRIRTQERLNARSRLATSQDHTE